MTGKDRTATEEEMLDTSSGKIRSVIVATGRPAPKA